MSTLIRRNHLQLFLAVLLVSCTRQEIEFGTVPDNQYTTLSYIDTVGVQLSTVLTDSFITSADTMLLFGRYNDPHLGEITARPFVQFTVPPDIPEIPASAVFDSLSFIIKPDKYHYGDTSIAQTISVFELATPISFSYNNKMYNTSDVAVKPVALGSRMISFSPSATDTIAIRLSDAKGLELFEKLRQQTTDVSGEAEFLNYFYGISIRVADNDAAAIYGLAGTEASLVMRVHYHTTIPYHNAAHIDFTSLANDYAFNQIRAVRTATGLVSGGNGLTELFTANTNGRAYSQPGTGLNMKLIFPGLRSVLTSNVTLKLLKADLILRPAYLSFDRYKYPLPGSLYLVGTDNTNLAGNAMSDSTGLSIFYSNPVIDDIYGENNYYRFNVTNAVNAMLNTAGTEDDGFYIYQSSTHSRSLDRLIVDVNNGKYSGASLLLYVLKINN